MSNTYLLIGLVWTILANIPFVIYLGLCAKRFVFDEDQELPDHKFTPLVPSKLDNGFDDFGDGMAFGLINFFVSLLLGLVWPLGLLIIALFCGLKFTRFIVRLSKKVEDFSK